MSTDPTNKLWDAIEAVVTLYDEAIFGYPHSVFVAKLAISIAPELDFPSCDLVNLRLGALLHDVGHAIHLVERTAPALTEDSRSKIEAHPLRGAAFLSRWQSLAAVEDIVLNHQERHDGKGYPRKLIGKDISEISQFVSICDMYVSLRNNNVFRNRPAYTHAQAISFLQNERGERWNEELFDRVSLILEHLNSLDE